MGPAIILDKSAVESIGADALRIQSEYFHTVITPILLWEICGDIEKARRGKCAESKVQALARKAHPLDSIATTNWRKICITELHGYRLDVDEGAGRRPVVDGAHRVPVPGGGYGVVIDHQPEEKALLRWSYGEWTSEDREYAREWKRVTRAIDLMKFKKRFGPALHPIESPEQLQTVVNQVLSDPALQMYLLDLLLDEIGPATPVAMAIREYWRRPGRLGWQEATRFCRHCIRAVATFYLAIGSGYVGTKSTNRVDLEYLFYLPFAPIFVSGDEGTHGKLAPLLVAADQTFVRASEFRKALQDQADRVARLRELQPLPDPDSFEPPEGSLIRELWIKSWGTFRPPPSARTTKGTADVPPAVPEQLKNFRTAMDFVQAHPDIYPPRPEWPNV